MDRTLACEAGNSGSTPDESTIIIKKVDDTCRLLGFAGDEVLAEIQQDIFFEAIDGNLVSFLEP